MADERVLFTLDGPVATLMLKRPEKLNAADDGMREGLSVALEAVQRDPSIRAVVITGAGRGFCAGGDIQKMAELKNDHQSVTFRGYLESGHDLVRKIRQLPKPVLASVNGPAA